VAVAVAVAGTPLVVRVVRVVVVLVLFRIIL
jgi:hypothetical protein